jgi:HTH-type transcriptional regulator / antitoxin HigA
MSDRGYTVADLADVLGSPSRASEILRRRRPLNLRMVQELHKHWKIPADALIAPYHLEEYPRRPLSA